MGRPRKFEPGPVAAAIKKAEGVLAVAARALKIDRTTIHDYVNMFPEVKAAYDEANEVVLDEIESVLVQQARAGDRDQVRFYLRTKGRHRGYADRMEHSGPDGGPIPVARVEVVNAPQPPPDAGRPEP